MQKFHFYVSKTFLQTFIISICCNMLSIYAVILERNGKLRVNYFVYVTLILIANNITDMTQTEKMFLP